jgi:hypothetical protein
MGTVTYFCLSSPCCSPSGAAIRDSACVRRLSGSLFPPSGRRMQPQNVGYLLACSTPARGNVQISRAGMARAPPGLLSGAGNDGEDCARVAQSVRLRPSAQAALVSHKYLRDACRVSQGSPPDVAPRRIRFRRTGGLPRAKQRGCPIIRQSRATQLQPAVVPPPGAGEVQVGGPSCPSPPPFSSPIEGEEAIASVPAKDFYPRPTEAGILSASLYFVTVLRATL